MAIQKLGIDAPAAEADDADRPFEGLETMAARRELDLTEAGIRTVLRATGFTGDFGYLPAEWRDDRGLPKHNDGIGEVPGLYCLGLQWGRRLASGLIVGAAGDAQHIADHIATR